MTKKQYIWFAKVFVLSKMKKKRERQQWHELQGSSTCIRRPEEQSEYGNDGDGDGDGAMFPPKLPPSYYESTVIFTKSMALFSGEVSDQIPNPNSELTKEEATSGERWWRVLRWFVISLLSQYQKPAINLIILNKKQYLCLQFYQYEALASL